MIKETECVTFYKSGILSQNECDCTDESYATASTNRFMTVVGYGTTKPEDKEYGYCEGFWILRSSQGDQWGDKGHLKLCINKNRPADNIGTCNLLMYPSYPLMK